MVHPVMTEQDFPHGLRCEYCHREIDVGEFYSEVLTGFIDDVPLVLLVCDDCDQP